MNIINKIESDCDNFLNYTRDSFKVSHTTVLKYYGEHQKCLLWINKKRKFDNQNYTSMINQANLEFTFPFNSISIKIFIFF